MLKKVALKTVTLEEGAMLLNDLDRRAKNREELSNLFCDIYRALPRDTHAKTFLQIVALTDNPDFEKVLVAGLEHPDAGVGLASLEGMARYKDDAAKKALSGQLAHHLPHIRKAAGEALIDKWGTDGIKAVIACGMRHEDREVVSSAYSVLSLCGEEAVPLIIDAMESMNTASLLQSAKLLIDLKQDMDIEDNITEDRVVKLVGVLRTAAGSNQPNLIISILELLGALREKLAGHEEDIAAFLHVEHATIKLVAHKVLSQMNTERARGLMAPVKIPLGMGGYLMGQEPLTKK